MMLTKLFRRKLVHVFTNAHALLSSWLCSFFVINPKYFAGVPIIISLFLNWLDLILCKILKPYFLFVCCTFILSSGYFLAFSRCLLFNYLIILWTHAIVTFWGVTYFVLHLDSLLGLTGQHPLSSFPLHVLDEYTKLERSLLEY